MESQAFNLLDEPWIRVLQPDYTVVEVSLKDALLNAHEYLCLAGEMPTQDVAVLRLLEAVLFTVFARVDEEGVESPVDATNAWERWGALWELGHFPMAPICTYFDTWHERFWLFHPKNPFYQTTAVEKGYEFNAAKLNGEISESGNKKKLFSCFAGEKKQRLSYSQAARWLLHLNGYDERGGRPPTGCKPRHGVGWLGQLGFIGIQGRTLFETLMFNLVFLRDGKKEWEEPKPAWEIDVDENLQSREIAQPMDFAGILTLQSRRISLTREGNYVTGYFVLGGDYFDATDAFSEQMTMWKRSDFEGLVKYKPEPHGAEKQLWREFPLLTCGNLPGVVSWNEGLRENELIDPDSQIVLWAVSLIYDDSQQSSVQNSYTDTLSFHLGVLEDLGKEGKITLITSEIKNCEKVAEELRKFSENVARAAGNVEKSIADRTTEMFYFRVDTQFRAWLLDVQPKWNESEMADHLDKWHEMVKRVAFDLADEIARMAGPTAFVGHMVKDKDEEKKKKKKKDANKEEYYSVPKARLSLIGEVFNLYPKRKEYDDTQE